MISKTKTDTHQSEAVGFDSKALEGIQKDVAAAEKRFWAKRKHVVGNPLYKNGKVQIAYGKQTHDK